MNLRTKAWILVLLLGTVIFTVSLHGVHQSGASALHIIGIPIGSLMITLPLVYA